MPATATPHRVEGDAADRTTDLDRHRDRVAIGIDPLERAARTACDPHIARSNRDFARCEADGDRRDDRVTGRIDLQLASIGVEAGSAPVGVASGLGSVWVASHRGTTLYRIDPNSDTIEGRTDMGQDCFLVSGVAWGRVFVSCVSATEVVDPRTDQVVASSACGQYLAFSADAIWSASPFGVQRCDPRTYRSNGAVRIGEGVTGMAFGFDSVWAANGGAGTVTRIDPTTSKVLATIPAASADPANFDCSVLPAYGAVWEVCDVGDRIYRIDPADNSVRLFPVPPPPAWEFGSRRLAAGLGSLWMTTSLRTVTRFDPATMKAIARYPVDPDGGGSGSISVFDGSLWLTNPLADTVWRDRVSP